MKEQIFAGGTGFDKLTAMKVWCVQDDTLNVFEYKGTPLFLLSEVLHCLYRDNRVVYKVGSTVRDILFGCRVKLSDVSAAKKVSKGRVSSNSWFTTIEGVERIIDTERKKDKLQAQYKSRRGLKEVVQDPSAKKGSAVREEKHTQACPNETARRERFSFESGKSSVAGANRSR